ncbi:unnamed protein product [Diabrotica balteata]|uniref:Uncharacterized protein n=1 Tax=Diabrotica balteata TaxID=107213 RepID=A0A9N9SP06_DIABA|nr:unnamed protein product [Diabrotica balteata]
MKKYHVRKLKDPNVQLKVSETLNTKVLKCKNAGTIEESLTIIQETVRELRYADDTIVFYNNIEGLQNLMNKITETSRTYGLDINTRNQANDHQHGKHNWSKSVCEPNENRTCLTILGNYNQ